MDKAIGNLIVTLSFDSSEFDSGISQAQRQLKNFERATRNSGEMAKQTGYSMNTSAVYVNNMKESYKAMNHTLSEQSKAYNELGDAHGKDSARRLQLGAQMEQTKAKMLRLNKEYERETMNIAKANSTWHQSALSIDKFGDGMVNTGQKMQSLGNQWSKASAVFTVAGGFLGKQAMDFERGMIDVQKTTNQTDEEIAHLAMTLREMSTEMPISIGQLQALAEAGGRFQIPRDRLADFAATMAKVGTATDMTAETAAEQFAKLSNITGLTVDEFENFGSSLVNLGNKTAAAESSIMNMAMGMAGTLSSLGMADQDILGLSAAMGSLGIESERGSSSISKFFVDLETMVQSGAEELQGFADVAGMSMDEFSTSFKDNPTEAFQAFIDGLKEVEEQGGSIVNTLDELGISEIRMRDTLLRLARGNETLADSLKVSRDGWSENKALQEEYENQLKSTAAQWEIFKNKLIDVAISAGNALLPVFTELMDSSDVLIDGIQNLAEWFVNLDDSTKGFIAKAAIAGVAFGPILSAVGTLVSFGGGIIKTFNALNRGLSMIDVFARKRAMGTLADSFTQVASGGNAAGQAIGGVTTSLTGVPGAAGTAGGAASAFTNPWILGTAAVVAAVVAVGSAIYDHATAPQQAHQAAVDATDGAYQEWFDSVVKGIAVVELAGTEGVKSAEAIKQAFSEAADEVMESNRRIQETIESQTGKPTWKDPRNFNVPRMKLELGQETAFGTTYTNFLVDDIRESLEGLPGVNDKVMGEIIAQYDSASTTIGFFMSSISEAKLNGREVTEDWAHAQITAVKDMATQTIENLERMKQAELEELNQKLESGVISERTYDKRVQAIERATQAEIEAVEHSQGQIQAILSDAARKKRELNSEEVTTMMNHMMKIADITGQSLSEIEGAGELLSSNLTSLATATGLEFLYQFGIIDSATAQSIAGMKDMEERTEAVRQALIDYGLVEVDAKDFGVRSEEAIAKIRELIDEGQAWADFTPAEKQFIIQTFGQDAVRYLLETIGIEWETLTPEQHNLIATVEGAEDVEEVVHLIAGEHGLSWNSLDIEDKIINLEAQVANETLIGLIRDRNLWNNEKFYAQFIAIDTNAPDAEEQIIELISTFTGISKEKIQEMMIDSNATQRQKEIEEAQRALRNLDGDSARVSIHVSDNASYTIANVTDQIRALDGRTATTYVRTVSTTARRMYAEGTNFHPGGLAVLGDGGRQEPFLTPGGQLGLSPDSDTLYDLPTGTKVWSSLSKFISELPKYASGTQKSFLDKIRVPRGYMNESLTNNAINNQLLASTNNGRDNEVVALLSAAVDLLEGIRNKDNNTYLDRQRVSRELHDPLTELAKMRDKLRNRQEGTWI